MTIKSIRVLVLACIGAAACDSPKLAGPVAAATVSVSAPVSAASSIPSAAPSAAAAPQEAEKPRLVPTRKLAVTNGAFACARYGTAMVLATTTANELADTVIARDQRAPAEVPPNDRNEPRLILPLSQIGITADKKGLVLVEARDRGMQKTAKGEEAPEVTWFSAGNARPLAPAAGAATSWRIWKGEAQPAVEPDVLGIEDTSGKILALRFLGAQRGVTPLAIDPAIPMFLVTVLGHASGVDDPIALKIVGLVDGDLKELLVINAGYRDEGNCRNNVCELIGPPGSLVLARDGGTAVLHARRMLPDDEKGSYCSPGNLVGEGCTTEEVTFRWNTSTHAFEPGTAKRVKVKQDAPNKPVRVLP